MSVPDLDMAAVARAPLKTVPEIAAALAVPESWVYTAAAAGTIPSLKVGRYRRFDLDAVLRALGTKA